MSGINQKLLPVWNPGDYTSISAWIEKFFYDTNCHIPVSAMPDGLKVFFVFKECLFEGEAWEQVKPETWEVIGKKLNLKKEV